MSALDSERLRSTLESLIEISNLDIEHITVLPPDDKDSIELWNEICSGKKNFHLLHDENQGIYKAMNIGGQAATGKFIVFWNSGERITSYRQVELLIDQLRICEFPQFISQGEIEWIPVHIQNDETYRMFIEGELGGFISHQTYFIDRKHFLNIGGFSSSFRVAADTDLILRMESEELTISTDVCPVFVQNSQFASLNNRIARLEILKISTTHGFRTKSFVRVSNTLRSEIRSWMKTLHRIFETPLSDNKLHHANSQNVSNTIYAENFGRNAILKCFQSSVLSNFKQTEIRRVAIVGGYLSDPEALFLAQEFPDADFVTVGIEVCDFSLDLNLRMDSEIPKFDVLLVSQVLEHVWNHQNFFDNVIALLGEGGYIWLACPASNKVHGSPDYFSGGFTQEYLVNNLLPRGVKMISSGGFGTKRLYWATHLIPGWLSSRGHSLPIFFAFNDRKLSVRCILTLRFLPILVALSFISSKPTSNPRWHTESWILGKK